MKLRKVNTAKILCYSVKYLGVMLVQGFSCRQVWVIKNGEYQKIHIMINKTKNKTKQRERTDFWCHVYGKGRHCCSVGELKITFASTCKESVFNVLFNVLFLVLDFPLGAPNTLLRHVIEGSIWRIVVGEGSWWGWGFSQDWWLGFWSYWNLSLTAVFWIDLSVACFKRV